MLLLSVANIIRVNEENIKGILALAVDVLKGGGIVAYPTETFYGLGVKFDIEEALSRLYELKKRPAEKAFPLIVGGDAAMRSVVSDIDEAARRLMSEFWPGPLSIVFPAAEGLSEFITSGGKVAVRMPGESFALGLARSAGFPFTSTSANPSGAPPPCDAETVFSYFGEQIDLIVDGGRTKGGLPSTLIDTAGGRVRVLRAGAVAADEIKRVAKNLIILL